MKVTKSIFAIVLVLVSFSLFSTEAFAQKEIEIQVEANNFYPEDRYRIRTFAEYYVRQVMAITAENEKRDTPDPRLRMINPNAQIVGRVSNGVRIDIYAESSNPYVRGYETPKYKEVAIKTSVRVGGNRAIDALERVLRRNVGQAREELYRQTEIRPSEIHAFRVTVGIKMTEVVDGKDVRVIRSVPKRSYEYEVYRNVSPYDQVTVTWRQGGELSLIGRDSFGNFKPTQYVVVDIKRVIAPTRTVSDEQGNLYSVEGGIEPLDYKYDMYEQNRGIAGMLTLLKVYRPENMLIWR